ncbi:MAG: hypothetical protein IPM29_27915 [Planctomycetes bacterium]|nr:hypothetical protein [Planctomycetota bacterium]
MNRHSRLPSTVGVSARAALLTTALVVAAAPCQDAARRPDRGPPRIHSVCDISQEFTFYMDGRFHTQYLQGVARDARNWGSLQRLDLSNVNLLVLTGGDPHIPYTDAAIAHLDEYVRGGGALLLMADGSDPMPPGTVVAEYFGARLTTTRATRPLRGGPRDGAEPLGDGDITLRRGNVLAIADGWQALVMDAADRPLLASRRVGTGTVLIGSRGLFGERPDAKDPINATWVTPLLVEAATRKEIDPRRHHESTWVEHERQLGPLTLEFQDGTAPFAERIAGEYTAVRPHLVAITGVEPAPGMIKRLLILPTGGGGFSSGERIAIGAFWGDYPEHRYPMVELIGHEAGHSWVLPYPEPLWNEPIATWLGIQVGRRLGMPEAQQTLDRQIRLGRRHDPDYTKVDPLADDAPRDLVWGKSFFVFEELERRFAQDPAEPTAMQRYFRTKRALLAPGRGRYSMDDCVGVWSRAVGTDLFPWFRSLAFDVDASRTDLRPD